MDFDEYETLPSNSTFTHMIAGAFAGMMEHCVMYPLDSVKTRMQTLKPNPLAKYSSVPEALLKMVHHEGASRPFRGVTAVIIGSGPAHALHFSCYEKLKRLCATEKKYGARNAAAQGFAGAVSTLLHDAVMNPAEVVKQRMQIFGSRYKSCKDCFSCIWKTEGARAFYRSYSTQLTMNVPFQAIHFMTYELCQEKSNHERTYNPKAHLISGGIAGAFASAVTTPLDVMKTLLNTQEQQALHLTKQKEINGIVNAAKTIYKFSGLRGFFQGVQARVLYQTPSTAISWSVYEFCKYVIALRYHSHNRLQEHCSLVAHADSIDKQHVSPSMAGISLVFNDKFSR